MEVCESMEKYVEKYGKICGEVWRNMCSSIEKYVEKYGRRNMWRSMEGEIALDRNRVDHATRMPPSSSSSSQIALDGNNYITRQRGFAQDKSLKCLSKFKRGLLAYTY